jgi:hypothetical protein
MGALIIEKNELEATHPKRARWFAEAIERAVAGHAGAFWGSVVAVGDRVKVGLREHVRGGARPWQRELTFPLQAMSSDVRRRLDYVLRMRAFIASREEDAAPAPVWPAPRAPRPTLPDTPA